MVSRKNPNGPSKIRQAARAGKILKEQQRKSAAGQHKISKDAINRGARIGLMPNSGAGAPMSSKKKRKVEKAIAHALKRKMALEGVVEMKGGSFLFCVFEGRGRDLEGGLRLCFC